MGEVGLPRIGEEEGLEALEAEARRSLKGLLSLVRWDAKGSFVVDEEEVVVGDVGGDLLPPEEREDVSMVEVIREG